MPLTADRRIEFVRAVLDAFREHQGVTRECSSAEYELARRWAMRGVPLATVLEGIRQTGGKPRRLQACERAVEENIARWHSAVGGLTSLPDAGPLEKS